jgi:hypothetical protein
MTTSGVGGYAAVGRVVRSCQVSKLHRHRLPVGRRRQAMPSRADVLGNGPIGEVAANLLLRGRALRPRISLLDRFHTGLTEDGRVRRGQGWVRKGVVSE